jgi:hypothetical protein
VRQKGEKSSVNHEIVMALTGIMQRYLQRTEQSKFVTLQFLKSHGVLTGREINPLGTCLLGALKPEIAEEPTGIKMMETVFQNTEVPQSTADSPEDPLHTQFYIGYTCAIVHGQKPVCVRVYLSKDQLGPSQVGKTIWG